MARGWFHDSARHSLAAKGIKTGSLQTKKLELTALSEEPRDEMEEWLEEQTKEIREWVQSGSIEASIEEEFPDIKVTSVKLVGSFALGNPHHQSDIDIMIEYEGDVPMNEILERFFVGEPMWNPFDRAIDIQGARRVK